MAYFESKLPRVGTTIFTTMSKLAADHQAVNLSQGFPDYPADKQLKELVCKFIMEDHNQYAPMAGVPALLEQIALKIERQYDYFPDPGTEITITTGASQAICSAISMIVRPDDEVIVIEPAYDSYVPAIHLNGGIPVIYELQSPGFFIDWSELERLISSRTKLLIINNPHNPTGSILNESDLEQLAGIVKKYNLLLLSDEVYEHLIFDGHSHRSILHYPELRSRGMAVFSFGKSLHATGWKVGYLIAPPEITSEFRKVHQFTVFCVNTPMQHAIAAYLKSHHDWNALSGFFQKKRDLLSEGMANIPLIGIKASGTYFQLYDYSEVSDLSDLDFSIWLTKNYGVATIPLSPFYSSGKDQKLIRICFAKKEETILEACRRLQKLPT